ncbi:hypothetical protein [Vibrio sonorensis]|uniref:hypothetical protein n=1 Tax=Vibrio sonorensis TaxID=1004316 RepID=UPI0008D990E9|nr:hypothetical protein [Vibrio sonorensis]
MDAKVKGRLTLLALVLFFAMPAIAAKVILNQNWYQSGVTNKGTLIDSGITYQTLGVANPYHQQSWQLAYRIPEVCTELCRQQLHLLQQSHIALGKYQQRVTPVVLVTPKSDLSVLAQIPFATIPINDSFSELIDEAEYLIVDPLGQLVMRYPSTEQSEQLPLQTKGLLADLRKLLKLSRVG